MYSFALKRQYAILKRGQKTTVNCQGDTVVYSLFCHIQHTEQ